MNENQNTQPIELPDVYFQHEQIELYVTTFAFHHPNVEHVKLPIAGGGYSSPVFKDGFTWGAIAEMSFSSGNKEMRQMGTELDIHLLFIANPFSIIENDVGERRYMRQQVYISSSKVPEGWRVRSARSIVFALADDPQMRLCAITFKSFNSEKIGRIVAEYQRDAASVTKRIFGRPVHSAFVRARLGVAGTEKVAPKDGAQRSSAAVIAIPSLTLVKDESGNPLLANQERAQKIAEYLQLDQLKYYPFGLAETTAREALELPWAESSAAPAALPPARVLTADEL